MSSPPRGAVPTRIIRRMIEAGPGPFVGRSHRRARNRDVAGLYSKSVKKDHGVFFIPRSLRDVAGGTPNAGVVEQDCLRPEAADSVTAGSSCRASR